MLLCGAALGAVAIGGTAVSPIAFDAASNSGYQAAASTYNWNHTVGTGDNRILVVNVAVFATGTVSGITFNTVALTSQKAVAATGYRAEQWTLVAPATGTHAIAVTLSASLASESSASSWFGVDPNTPIDASASATGTGNPASLSITPVRSHDRIVDCLAAQATAPVVGSGQNQRTDAGGAAGTNGMSDLMADPLAATTMQWTGITVATPWSMTAIALRPDAAIDITASAALPTVTVSAPTGSASTTDAFPSSALPTVTVTAPTGTAATITCDFVTTHQTMLGWGGNGGSSQWDSISVWTVQGTTVLDKLVNEFGLNMATAQARPFNRHTTNYFAAWDGTSANYTSQVSSHHNEYVISSTYHWDELDDQVTQKLLPLIALANANGDTFDVVWSGSLAGGANTTNGAIVTNPQDCADFVVAGLQHMSSVHGITIARVMAMNEPDYPPGTVYPTGTFQPEPVSEGPTYLQLLRATLNAAGFTSTPISAYPTNNVQNAKIYYDDAKAFGTHYAGDILAFHNLNGSSSGALDNLGTISTTDSIPTWMSEHGAAAGSKASADYTVLFNLIKRANISYYNLFGTESTGNQSTAEGIYVISAAGAPSTAAVLTQNAKFLRQITLKVRKSAVRHEGTSTASELVPLVFQNANGTQVVCVQSTSASTVPFSIAGLTAGTYGIFYTVGTDPYTVTSYDQHLSNQTIGSGGIITTSIPGKGVITIYQTVSGSGLVSRKGRIGLGARAGTRQLGAP